MSMLRMYIQTSIRMSMRKMRIQAYEYSILRVYIRVVTYCLHSADNSYLYQQTPSQLYIIYSRHIAYTYITVYCTHIHMYEHVYIQFKYTRIIVCILYI